MTEDEWDAQMAQHAQHQTERDRYEIPPELQQMMNDGTLIKHTPDPTKRDMRTWIFADEVHPHG
jgi:hypothetical protein